MKLIDCGSTDLSKRDSQHRQRRRPLMLKSLLLVALIAVQVQISASDEHDHIVSYLCDSLLCLKLIVS